MLMGSAVVTDAPADCQILFLKVDVLPSQPCHFPKPETCEIGYLHGQDCVFAPLAKLCNQFLVSKYQRTAEKTAEADLRLSVTANS